MNIQRATPVNELLAKLIFLILPTALVGYFLLWNANQYYSILHAQAFQQTLYLAAGMGIAAIFYSFRIRFLPTFALLLLVLYSIYEGLDRLAVSEFDSFFISVQFLVFAILFATGWLVGWGFVRLRYWAVLLSAVLLCSCILLIAKANTESVTGLLEAFAPALLYSVYIVFTSEQIYSYKDKSKKFWWFLSRRLVFFGILAALLLGGVVLLMKKEIKETVANYGGGGKGGKNNMMHKNHDGTFDLDSMMQPRGSISRDKELMFCAHIDHYFPNTQIPNPLYMTAFYYTKFDTLSETFEKDSAMPDNDLFAPDPTQIPLFSMKSDSSVIKNAMGEKFRTTVESEVYTKMLSPSTFVAPNTGFFVQPITVEKDFREEFKTAFRTKSYVSELNSAYFVYNSPKPEIRKFQEQRFEVMRKYTDYSQMDPKFMQYYTYMPSDTKFKTISDLAHKVTANAQTPADKIIAIRDYFLSKDENGDQLYHYTDNPGVPDIPNASKLLYFLNENHKGYCAYFAGATLFMLRSLGIPSRIAVGFLTVDRSDKNKGWYWYYADQAHAWVQVYFPGLGWMDFDTTVGNSDARESPKPDGTPPMQPPKAWLAADGIVVDIDTAKKTMDLRVKHFIFHDKEYNLPDSMTVSMDLKIAEIKRDSIDVPLSTLQKGEEATAVSYAEVMKKMEPAEKESGTSIIKRFPVPAPIDEVYLHKKDVLKKDEKQKINPQEKPVSIEKILWTGVGIIAAILLFLLLLPRLILAYYIFRYKRADAAGNKSYWAYRAATYYLHQVGIFRGHLTPMQYANAKVDPKLGTNLVSFMNIYLKKKYAKQSLTMAEQENVDNFLMPFLQHVRKKTQFKKRLYGFVNPVRSVGYFVADEEV